jgi:hypothetical protein
MAGPTCLIRTSLETTTSSTALASQTMLAALGALAQQGITMKYDEISHVVVQGNFAYLRSTGHFGEDSYVFHDLFRVSHGKCVEHRDVMVPSS